MTEERLLTIPEASRKLQLRQETIRRYIQEGKLVALELPGGRFRIRESELDKILKPVEKGISDGHRHRTADADGAPNK